MRRAVQGVFAARRSADDQRVLVIADAAPTGDDVAVRIRAAAGDHAQLDVVAPVLPPSGHDTLSHRELAEAHRRLEATLAWAREHGFTAAGTIGGEDPDTAIADAVRRSGAEAVLFVSGDASERSGPPGRMLRLAGTELTMPVVHVRA